MVLVSAFLVLLCTGWILSGTVAVWRVVRRRPSTLRQASLPALSVLKPLCGADAGLEANLESFFQQDYPAFELIFGVEKADDPAVGVVDALRRRYPHVASLLVVHDGVPGLNPKVRNLRGMLPAARYDMIVISDSNIRAPAGYLYDLAAQLRAGTRPVGLVTNLFRGGHDDSLGSALESVQLNGFCAAAAAMATTLGDSLVIGKSMMFSRRVFERLGGFESVSHVLAEDYVMGKKFEHAGYEVRIAPIVLDNVTSGTTLQSFVARQLRWAMLRCRLRPTAYLFEPVTSPLVLLPVAWFCVGPAALLWAAVLFFARDVVQWVQLRGPSRLWLPFLLGPARDLLLLWVWLLAPWSRHVSWRGHRVRLSAGTLAYACAE